MLYIDFCFLSQQGNNNDQIRNTIEKPINKNKNILPNGRGQLNPEGKQLNQDRQQMDREREPLNPGEALISSGELFGPGGRLKKSKIINASSCIPV